MPADYRKRQKPDVSGPDRDGKQTLTHPAFATVSFTNAHYANGVDLFGANVRAQDTVIIRAHTASMSRGTVDRVHPEKVFLEMEMTTAQFAQAITHMNTSSGVAATIRYASSADAPLESYPLLDPLDVEENMKARTDVRIESQIKEIMESMVRLKELASADGSVSKKALKEAVHDIDVRMRNLPGNLQYYGDLLKDDTERFLHEAKMNLHAAAQRLGMVEGAAPPLSLRHEDQ